jgi:benzylsuccinate CoA-transferase BbsF subunit
VPGVFDGIKVLDFTWAAIGPLTTKYLADYGATVIRVESRSHPCVLRTSPPYVGGVPEVDYAAYFALYSANKLSLTLNMNHPKAKDIIKKLICWADILAENFAPGVMERWGLGYEEVRKLRPDIIMFRTSGQGQTGPHSHLRGTGVNLVGLAGFAHLTGWPKQVPCQPYGPYTDVIAPRFGATMLIAALDYRRRTGKGQMLDVSQYEAGVNFLAPLLLDYFVNGRVAARRGNLDPLSCPHNAYLCRGEDSWCVIVVSTEKEWETFCRIIGNPVWTSDERFATLASRKENEQELDKLVTGWTMEHTADEIVALMQQKGIPAWVVQTNKDLYEDPQLRHRCYLWRLDHKVMGQISHLGQLCKLSKTPAEARMPAPCLGEHTEYVCLKVLGMSEHEFDELLVEGVFH